MNGAQPWVSHGGDLLLLGLAGFLILSALYRALVVLSRGPAPTAEDRPETAACGCTHAPRSGPWQLIAQGIREGWEAGGSTTRFR